MCEKAVPQLNSVDEKVRCDIQETHCPNTQSQEDVIHSCICEISSNKLRIPVFLRSISNMSSNVPSTSLIE